MCVVGTVASAACCLSAPAVTHSTVIMYCTLAEPLRRQEKCCCIKKKKKKCLTYCYFSFNCWLVYNPPLNLGEALGSEK